MIDDSELMEVCLDDISPLEDLIVKKSKKKRINHEYQEQKQVVSKLKELSKENNNLVLCFSVANEHSSSKGGAVQAGLVAGVSDLIVIFDDSTLYLEMKRKRTVGKTGKISKENLQKPHQKDFEELINKTKYNDYALAYGYEEAMVAVNKKLKKGC